MIRHLSVTMLVVMMSLGIVLSAAPAFAQGETVIASDDFNRADESPFAVSGNWRRVVAGNYDGYSNLVSNHVSSAFREGIYYWQGPGTFNNSRQFARERVVLKDGELGLVLLGGPDQAIMVGWGPPGVGNTVYIYWYGGGADHGQLLTAPSSVQNGDIIEASLENGIIYAKVNGDVVASVANTTTLTSGNPGFITYFDPLLPAQVSMLDDWEAGTPASYTISGTITESAAGLGGVLVTATGGFSGNTTTAGDGTYSLSGISANATSIVLTPTLSGHTMSPLHLTVAGPVNANVTGQDFTSTLHTSALLTVNATHGSVTRNPDQAQYTFGSNVTLTPVPDAGYNFTGWTGDVPPGHASDNPLQLTMDDDRTITAGFAPGNLTAYDDFDRADETPLAVGGNWEAAFAGGTVNLSQDHIVGATGDALYYWQGPGSFSTAGQFAQATVVNAGGQTGLVLLGAPGQGLVSSWSGGTLYIYWYASGTYQGQLATSASTLQNGDLIEAVLDGGTVFAKVNGAVVASAANTTTLTSGTPGFEAYLTGGALDDWGAGAPASYTISGTITEDAVGLSGVLVTASGGFSGSTSTDGSGAYTLTGVPTNATSILLTPTLSGHTMSPLNRTVAGPVTANVTGQDFTSSLLTGVVLTVQANHGSVTRNPDLPQYTPGTDVTLTPVADPGYAFTGWSGDVPSGHELDNPLVVTMTADRTITAGFVPPNLIAADDFNRANEVPFGVGGNWGRVVAGNFDGHSNLVSNHVTSASLEGIYYWRGPGTFDATRQFARQRVVQKDGELGLVLLGGPDQSIMVSWGPPNVGSTVYIYWYAGGADHGQLLTAPSSVQNGDIIEASLEGGVIYAKVNGNVVASVPNTTTLTSGNPGFITYFDPALPGSVAILDDWEAGTPASYTIGGTITENAAGLGGVLVTASGGFAGSTTTAADGTYTLSGVPANATSILLTPSLAGHTMSPLTRTVTGPVLANVTGQDFTSTLQTTAVLTVQATHGSVTKDPDLPEYTLGASVTLTPVADAGYNFAGWSGDAPSGHELDDPLIVTMNGDRTITALFTLPNLNAYDDFDRADETPLAVDGNWQAAFGSATANLTGNHVVGATGDALYYWQGPGTFGDERQFAQATVVDAGGQAGLVLLGGPGQGLVTSWNGGTLYVYWYAGGAYETQLASVPSTIQAGDVIQAVLDAGTVYAKINGAVVASVENTTTLTSGTPGFEMYLTGGGLDNWGAGTPPLGGPLGILASAGPGGTISPSGLVGVAYGEDKAFTLTADAQYHVDSLYVDGVSVTPTSPYTFTNVTADHSIRATFATDPFTIALAVDPPGSGSIVKSPDQAHYASGSVVLLTASAASGYHFDHWSGDTSGTSNPISLTVYGNRSLTAHFVPNALSSQIVISQVYSGGGNAGTTYQDDYVELFNLGNVPVTVTGWTVQCAAANGLSWTSTPLTGSIPPGGYYLVQEAQGAGGTTPLPAPDAVGTHDLASNSGMVALLSDNVVMTTPCPGSAALVDMVGYGSASCWEGAATPALNDDSALFRGNGGCDETNNNSADFVSGVPAPRNSASPTHVCDVWAGADNLPATEFALSSPAPNPSRGASHLSFALPVGARVRLSVLDVQGRVISSLVDDILPAGRHDVLWNGNTPAGPARPGLYFVRLEVPGRHFVRSMIVMR